jgi:AraC-like DNA-binding protein/quercetin dioxygenase-like cupin family protein
MKKLFRGVRAYRFFDVDFLGVAHGNSIKHQIFFFAKGEGAFSLGGNNEDILNNSLFFITPNIDYRIECNPDRPLDFFIVQFEVPTAPKAFSLDNSYFTKIPPSGRDPLLNAMQDLVVACARQLQNCSDLLSRVLMNLEKLIHTNSIIFATRHIGRYIKDIPRHFHFSEYQIDYFNQGRGRFLLGDEWLQFTSGDLFFLPPKVQHEIVFAPSVEVDNFSLKINMKPDKGLSLPDEPFKISIRGNERSALLVIFKTIVGKYIMDSPISLIQLTALLHHIQLVRGNHMVTAVPSDKKIETVKHLINGNFFRPLRINWLAGEIGVSPEYLSRLFKKTTGENLSNYVCRVRLEAGLNMVRNTDMPLKKVAAECGYQNVGYFSTSFKKKFGVTPGSVRKNGMPIVASGDITAVLGRAPDQSDRNR